VLHFSCPFERTQTQKLDLSVETQQTLYLYLSILSEGKHYWRKFSKDLADACIRLVAHRTVFSLSSICCSGADTSGWHRWWDALQNFCFIKSKGMMLCGHILIDRSNLVFCLQSMWSSDSASNQIFCPNRGKVYQDRAVLYMYDDCH